MNTPVSCSVFELASPSEPAKHAKRYEDLDSSNRVFLKILGQCAHAERLRLDFRVHPFPYLRLKQPEKLNNVEFDADIAVCMYPELAQVGPELAHILIDRKKSFRHVFLVTRSDHPENSNEIKSAINTIPRASIRHSSMIYEPIPLSVSEGEDIYKADEANVMSYWHIQEIRKEDARRRIQTILLLV